MTAARNAMRRWQDERAADDAAEGGLVEEFDNVMRLLREPRRPAAKAKPPERKPFDLDAALDLVERAAEALDRMEEQSREVAEKAERIAAQAKIDNEAANDTIKALQRLVASSEARVKELETRLGDAEQRAEDADGWVTRFHDTIIDAFSARQKPASGRPA